MVRKAVSAKIVLLPVLAIIFICGTYFLATSITRNLVNQYQTEKLHQAACDGNLAVVKQLIESGVDVDKRDGLGYTPMFSAAEEKQIEVAKYLLSKGANVNARDYYGSNLINHAIGCGSTDIVEMLLARGANPNSAEIEKKDTPLHTAARCGNKRIMECLLNHGADINAKDSSGKTPVDYAQTKQTVVLLLEHGAKIKNILTATIYDDPKVVARFLPAPKNKLNDALSTAASANSAKSADFLISKGADVNFLNETYRTPLTMAVETQSTSVMKLLLKKGANPNITDASGVTPLNHAALSNNAYYAIILLEHGAKVDASANNGQTPLHTLAIYGGSTKVAEILIANGANINATDKEGHTPLDCAVQKNRKEMEILLRKHGAK